MEKCDPGLMFRRQATPRERLRQVVELAATHGHKDLARWFEFGVDDFLSGRCPTLCRGLGLRGEGIPSPATEAATNQRNAHIRHAFALLSAPPNTSHGAKLDLLGKALTRFESITWPWARHYAKPPARLDGVQVALWRAFKTGARIPDSKRHLRRIIMGGGQKRPPVFVT